MPDPEFDLYLSLLSRFLRLKPAQRDEIADELRDDLEQRLEDFAAEGLSRDAAIRAALDELGDAAELAKHFTHLARIRRRRLIMRLTFGTVAAMCAVVLFVTAFWPAHPQAPAPGIADAASEAQIVSASEPSTGTSRSERLVMPVKHLPSVDLANALLHHFHGETVSITAEPISNSLLMTFPKDLREEIRTTVGQLDRAPMRLAVDVTVAEFPVNGKTLDGAPEVRAPFKAGYFEGPAEEVRKKLQDLRDIGLTRRFKRFHILAIHNQITQCEDKKASSTDQPAKAPGTMAPDAGSTVQFTPRVADDRSVTMELVIRDWPGPTPAKTPNLKASEIANLLTDNFLGTISVPSGRAVVASSIEHETDYGPTQIIYIVSAEVADPPVAREQAVKVVEVAPPGGAE